MAPEDKRQIEHIRKKVDKIEDEHVEMSQLIRDFQKDFHILAKSFTEVKDVLKTISEASTDVKLFKQRYEAHREAEKESNKRIHERQDKIEKNQSRVVWLVMTAVIVGLLKQVIVGG